MRARTLWMLSSLFVLAACSSGPARIRPAAQTAAPVGTVRGQITQGGSPLPGTTITITPVNKAGSRVAVTDLNGEFHFVGLAIGQYILHAELESMRQETRTITISPTAGANVDLDMKLDSVAEAITVTASTPAVQESMEIRANGAPMNHGYIPYQKKPAAPPPASISASAPIPMPVEAPAGPVYAAIKESGFTDTSKEATSTFSIDVDRASYTNIRKMLASNVLPPHDAVRIEEMVNYFTYDYPAPEGGQPFSITTEVAGAPWESGHRVVRIGVQGKKLEPWAMKPNNLVFLIDDSGSMNEPDKLPLIKQSFRLLVDQLRAQDRIAVVAYAGYAGLVLPSTSGADKDRIIDAVTALEPGGGTNGAAGIQLAYQIAKENFLPDGNNRVILATDGDFNLGASSEAELEKLIVEKRKENIALSVIGVGSDNLQDAKMELLADKGNGNYAYVDKLLEAQKVFVEELGGTLITIAKDVKLQIEFDPSRVASYRLIGYEDRRLANADFADDTKDAGELGSGHSVTALYEIVPAAGATRGPIATLQVRYKEPNASSSTLLQARIVDEGKSAWEASDDFKFVSAVTEMGMLLRESPYKGSANYGDALQLARSARGVDLQGYRGELVRMLETASKLTTEKSASESSASCGCAAKK